METKKTNTIIEKIDKATYSLEKYPYIVLMFIIWLVYMSGKESNPWKFTHFIRGIALLMATYCLFFFLKLLLSPIPDYQKKLRTRIGNNMKCCFQPDFILAVALTGLLFWIRFANIHFSITQQIHIGISFIAQIIFLQLLLTIAYNLAPNNKSGQKWVLGIFTIVTALAILSSFNFPFSKYIGYFSPFIFLFYLHIIDMEIFIQGITVFIVVIEIALILLSERPYRKLAAANTDSSIIKYLPLFDWFFVAVCIAACVCLFILDNKAVNDISHAAIIAVMLYIIISSIIDKSKFSLKISSDEKKSSIKRLKIPSNKKRNIIKKLKTSLEYVDTFFKEKTPFNKKKNAIKKLKLKKY